jgi:hypothetical protein
MGRVFFSSLVNKALPGLCFLNLSLLAVETRASYPLLSGIRAASKRVGADLGLVYFECDGALGDNAGI